MVVLEELGTTEKLDVISPIIITPTIITAINTPLAIGIINLLISLVIRRRVKIPVPRNRPTSDPLVPVSKRAHIPKIIERLQNKRQYFVKSLCRAIVFFEFRWDSIWFI